ncbi:MAG: hypothetical protein K2N82_12835 [Lachnospiraceae bacterium]|nr:hypothetical protein [Lachnospiraceae bacterium]
MRAKEIFERGIVNVYKIIFEVDYERIHIPYIKSDNPKSPYSKGCITIPVQDYLEFGVNVGFIKGEAVDDIGEIWETYDGDDYQKAKEKLLYNTYAQEFDGHMVIDRQYYDDKDKYLKFNGSRSEE